MAVWRLFIDESGDFGPLWSEPLDNTRNDHVVVAGWLIDTDGFSEVALGRVVDGLASWLPRPIHAAHLHLASLHALSIVNPHSNRARRAVERIQPSVRDAASRLTARWRRGVVDDLSYDAQVRDTTKRAESKLREGTLPKIEDLKILERALNASPPEDRDALIAIKGETQAILSSIIKDRIYPLVSEGKAIIIASSETCLGDALPKHEGDRYLTLLAELLVRVVDLLTARGGEHEVRLNILRRNVYDAAVGFKTPLRNATVNEILHALSGNTTPCRHVRLCIEAICGYEQQTPATLILADFFANRVRRATMSMRSGLCGISNDVLRFTGLPLHDEANRTTIATSGEGAALVERARAGDHSKTQIIGALPRRWACEQAEEWAQRVQPEAYRWRSVK